MNSCCDSVAVIGLGFGDEGKGRQVHALASSLSNPLVIRYSGGQQAGHTVYTNPTYRNLQHVFSNFGSGTFAGAPTYWSKYCTFDPAGTIKELLLLKAKGFEPLLYIDKNAPITTPYEKMSNIHSMQNERHGTCGVGVGKTYERESKLYSLTVGDLQYPSVMDIKLNLIKEEYYCNALRMYNSDLIKFKNACKMIIELNNFIIVDSINGINKQYDNIIFEGSQGLLLDQDIGFFPHVTRGNVGTKNIIEMGFTPKLFLMTRAYQTRHGNGPMTNEDAAYDIAENPYETNTYHKFQGNFRRAILDVDLLKYGMSKDLYINTTKNKELVVTCMDHVSKELSYTRNGYYLEFKEDKEFLRCLAEDLNVSKVSATYAPWSN